MTAIAINPKNPSIFASGELGPRPKIHVWDSNSMLKQCTLDKGVIKGIACMAFSPKGERLVACCIDDNHMIAVFDVKSTTLVSLTKGDTAVITDVVFKDESVFFTGGVKHFKQWTINGANLKSVRGNFGQNKNILCCLTLAGDEVLAGSVTGDLQVWKGTTCKNSISAHKRALDAICYENP